MTQKQMDIWEYMSSQGISYGKTSQAACHQESQRAKTSASSLKKSAKSKTPPPMFLDLRTVNGQKPDASWVMGGLLLGEYTMRSFGASPNEDQGSRLSQILEATPPQKYCLSAKACQGILNRAENRGKELPDQLRTALMEQIAHLNSEGGAEFDKDGRRAGKGVLMSEELSGTLGVVKDIFCLQGNGIDRKVENGCNGKGFLEEESYTLNTIDRHAVAYRKTTHPKTKEDGQGYEETETNDTLNCFDNYEARTPTIILENQPHDSRVKIREDGVFQTLCGYMGTGGNNVPMVMNEQANNVVRTSSVVRRLTPKECERLQGFPDDWTMIGDWVDSKGKKHKSTDSARYKAIGNSLALPFWFWLLRRISAQYPRIATMGSLFDGIGGFPYCWEMCNGKGSAVWASEIEEFPIAVTKVRFPDGEKEEMG